MRTGLKILFLVLVLGILAYGLLPPILAESHLRDDASAAANAGATSLVGTSSHESVHDLVAASLASHRGVRLASVKVSGGIVTVVAKENVHTFMSATPGIEHWFHLTVTESASEAG
jgi:hypothetical protein